ncbi:hypothetical protein [Brevundimonas variabilis]|uniref:Uncharacterized protein n=1 Tax=Brevundimonas variabilis TaxID=74312 RepID=A0A7W9FH73_9CAUL|nr:hypothetical protein [Brevundimonas variabilis]MBB5747373.1 hypothetical protein [Brevundimonas variabilis]
MVTRSDTPPPLALKILGILALAGFGAATGAAVASLAASRAMAWSDEVALVMAVGLLAMAIASAVVMATRPASVPKGCGLLQIATLLLASAMFLLPIYGGQFATADVVFGAVIVLLVIQTVTNVLLWNKADEMLRRIMAETGAMAFFACQAALFVYAAAERLDLVGPVSSWGLIGITMGVYLCASCLAAARRGIH